MQPVPIDGKWKSPLRQSRVMKLMESLLTLARVSAQRAFYTGFWLLTFCQLAGATSLWNHNGSVVELRASGNAREFYYAEPRKSLPVAPGTLLFTGKREGNIYTGQAYVFSSRCGPRSFAVMGPVSDDERTVTLYGRAPRRNANCEIVGSRDEVLIFSYLQAGVPDYPSNEPPPRQRLPEQANPLDQPEPSQAERDPISCSDPPKHPGGEVCIVQHTPRLSISASSVRTVTYEFSNTCAMEIVVTATDGNGETHRIVLGQNDRKSLTCQLRAGNVPCLARWIATCTR